MPEWKFLKVNDKEAFARNNFETGKILNKVVMMNAAMTIEGDHGCCDGPCYYMAKVSVEVDFWRRRQ